MSKFTKEMVKDYADKLLIGLSLKEIDLILSEFDIINEKMELITKIKDIEKVIPKTHGLDNFSYTLREDKVIDSPSIDKLLSNASKVEGRKIEVLKVVN